jgi:rubrerythrin
MQDQPEFQGSFSEGSAGEQRDHEGHLLRGSFGDGNCPECLDLVRGHAQHTKGSFSEGSGGLVRDEEGDLMKGSFADSACPICRAEAATASS